MEGWREVEVVRERWMEGGKVGWRRKEVVRERSKVGSK